MRQCVSGGWLTVALLFGCGGCSTQGVPYISSSQEETTVKGVVRVRGKPVDNGTVVFNAANVGRPNVALRKASINKDGTYSLKTLVGGNNVQVSCKELLKAENRMFNESEFSLTAERGETTFNIDIPPASLVEAGAKSPGSPRSRR
jgi:hypothetical protein